MTRIYHLVDGCFMCRVHIKGKVVFYMSMNLNSLSVTGNCYDSSFLPWLSAEFSTFCSRACLVKRASFLPNTYITGKTWKEIKSFLDPKFDFDSDDLPF